MNKKYSLYLKVFVTFWSIVGFGRIVVLVHRGKHSTGFILRAPFVFSVSCSLQVFLVVSLINAIVWNG